MCCPQLALKHENARTAHSIVLPLDVIVVNCQLASRVGYSFWQVLLVSDLRKFGDIIIACPVKRSFSYSRGVQLECSNVQASLGDPFLCASFLAALFHHSSDWLLALSIASCGLKLDDETIRREAEHIVAMCLYLSINPCIALFCLQTGVGRSISAPC